MEVEKKDEGKDPTAEESSQRAVAPMEDNKKVLKTLDVPAKTVKFDSSNAQESEAVPDMDTLYPIFWSLQESFSTPTKIFNNSHFQSFKDGLGATMRKFKAVHQELQDRGSTKHLDESKRGLKRKRNLADDELSSSFNPKYLTSRDLFDLEVPSNLHLHATLWVLIGNR